MGTAQLRSSHGCPRWSPLEDALGVGLAMRPPGRQGACEREAAQYRRKDVGKATTQKCSFLFSVLALGPACFTGDLLVWIHVVKLEGTPYVLESLVTVHKPTVNCGLTGVL